MSLQLALYPHPILKHRSRPIVRVNSELKEIVADMFEVMYSNEGVGLAANQVHLPIRLFVCNPTGKKGEGEELVFINPVISQPRGIEEEREGCLSLPGIRAMVKRSKTIWVSAYDLTGREIRQDFNGFLARIIQHETDHLDGVLFIDRLTPERLRDHADAIDGLVTNHASLQRTGTIPTDSEIQMRISEMEAKFC